MTDDGAVPADVARWCAEHVGSPPARRFFEARSMSHVHGLVLADGRRIAVKVRGAEHRLAGCAAVQAAVRAAGVDAPKLIAGPAAFEPGAESGTSPDADTTRLSASAEEWIDGGVPLPPLPADELAVRFARLHARTIPVATAAVAPRDVEPAPPWLDYDHVGAERVWPPAAAPRWDPHRIEHELPEAVRRTAAIARERLLADDVRALPVVVGHGDLNGVNTRWHADGADWRVVVHDWDSVAARPEAVLIGMCATDFLCAATNTAVPIDVGQVLLDAYADLRGVPWSRAEQETAWATSAWLAAYNAAFEHLHGAPGSFATALDTEADARLRLAGC